MVPPIHLQMYILDEMFSPLVTPFILYLSLRKRAPQIVDFLRNFTIDVSGVGDVCSFAEMNVKKHGNSEVRYTLQWNLRTGEDMRPTLLSVVERSSLSRRSIIILH